MGKVMKRRFFMKTKSDEIVIKSKINIPEVLKEYLLGLIDAEPSTRHIQLSAHRLGIGEVQDIVCETNAGPACYRVFGFPPIDISLTVVRKDGQIRLAGI